MTFPTFATDRRHLLAGLGATSALTVAGCAPTLASGPAPTSGSAGADALLESVAFNLMAHEPERATGLGVDTGEHAALRGKLENQSAAGQLAYAATLKRDLERVRAFPRTGLSPEQVTSLEVVESAYATALDGFAQPYGDVAVGSWRNAPYVVIQNVGTYLDAPRFMDADVPLETEQDAAYHLDRLAAMPSAFAGERERMVAARAMGVVPPDFLLDKAREQMATTITSAQAGELFAEPLRARLKAKGLPESFADRAKAVETGPIAAALQSQLAELVEERKIAKGDAGMWSRPGGASYYAWALKASTTTTRSPDEIHQEGHDTLALLHDRMDTILKSIGYSTGTVGARMHGLSDDKRYQFSEGDPGRAEIMSFLKERLAWIQAQMPRAFGTVVNPNMEIRRLPLAEEPGAPGAYGGAGSKDGKTPGRMWINLRTTDLHRKYTLPTLVHHEMIPGHIWEGEFSHTLPTIRSVLAFNAFSEGWALYAEQLADELGAYDANPVWRLGYLQDAAFRAARMVVDTGMHAKRWSRAQALAFISEATGDSPDEMASEIDRYCSWPGQACGYMVGKLEILRQRELAQSALGSAYNLKDFDDAVIMGGNAPLDVMAKNVARYVERARG